MKLKVVGKIIITATLAKVPNAKIIGLIRLIKRNIEDKVFKNGLIRWVALVSGSIAKLIFKDSSSPLIVIKLLRFS